MKINFDKQKSAEALTGIVKKSVDASKKAVDASKKAVESTHKSINHIVEKSKQDNYERRLKKYNPLFPDKYNSDSFKIPNIIMIVDDAVRRDIDVCEGAIGWLNSDSGSEVLYLYDEFVKSSGIQFIPSVTCDAMYYVDSFDRNKFIRTDYIFSKAHEERMAELKHIAHSLGAKSCTIEITEQSLESSNKSQKADFSGKLRGITANVGQESSVSQMGANNRSGRIEIYFEGNNEPKRPNLKWFANEDTIKNLVEIRCTNENAVKSEVLELSGSTSATMSRQAAYHLDAAMSKNKIAQGGVSMDSQAAKEHHSKLFFSIEF